MEIDIQTIPFSRYGSYFAVNFDRKENKLLLRDVHGGDESPSKLFELIVLDDDSNQIEWEELACKASETALSVSDKNTGKLFFEIILPEPSLFHVKVTKGKIKMIADKIRYDSFNKMSSNEYEYISYKKEMKYLFSFTNEPSSVYAPWESVGNSEVLLTFESTELRITSYRTVLESSSNKLFDDSKESVFNEYNQWYKSMPRVSPNYEKSKQMASYLLWANTVEKEGLLTEDITYMSKNWMQNIWSWDNCFNAIMLSENQPELAYNQLKVFIDYQDKSGAYPDFINDKYVSYNCVKPPIHAWAYKKMIEKNSLFSEINYLKPMYESFVENTQFWLNYRVHPYTGLVYYTHGNDSGWDNASIFTNGMPVSSPDLVAHLIRQLDVLSNMASALKIDEDEKKWKALADDYFNVLIEKYYFDNQFVALNALTGEKIQNKTSGLLYMPTILSYRMDKNRIKELVGGLLSKFESNYGLATEELTSNRFKGDGYWLGPIWAPQTYLFVDALIEAGFTNDAYRIAEKFCDATLIGGMAENFNPITGEGNDDMAFAWTSSVFMLLADMVFKGDTYD